MACNLASSSIRILITALTYLNAFHCKLHDRQKTFDVKMTAEELGVPADQLEKAIKYLANPRIIVKQGMGGEKLGVWP